MNIREILLRFLWDPKFQSEISFISVLYESRGFKNEREFVLFSEISKIGKKFIWIKHVGKIEEKLIPIHRIRKIINISTNKVYFSHE
ncbi:MAG: RNA repair domain-containing protein [Candidatus Lokiarchaeota archaeon]|nr:RNA repair domain-containing protein [Candidatus Harpocratesius repetitus]